MKTDFFYLLIFLFLFWGCKIDNYVEPEISLSGKIIDSETKKLVESSGINNGSIIELFEGDSKQHQLLNTTSTGEFLNSRLFADSYKIVAKGPFESVTDTIRIDVKSHTDIEVPVIPNSRLEVLSVTIDGTSGRVKTHFEKVATNQNLLRVGVVWSTFPYPNVTVFPEGNIIMESIDGMNEGEKEFKVEGLKSGKTYYIRSFALTDNSGEYYNYSEQISISTK